MAIKQSAMIKLSVVIITFNEEQNIKRCLESVKEVADEIVVLDSFSTDNTEAICKNYGVNFFTHTFDGHIQQKNRAITYASSPYILSVDADEALSEELKRSILQKKKNWDADGYTLNRLTNYCGKWIHHCGWYPDRKLRLFDSRKGKWAGLNPHDKYFMDKGAVVKHLKGDLLHYSYYTVEQHHQQTEKFSTIAAKSLFDKGKKTSFLNIWFSPLIRFIRDYFFNLGFLDGKTGLTICLISAGGTKKKYQKLKKLKKQDRR